MLPSVSPFAASEALSQLTVETVEELEVIDFMDLGKLVGGKEYLEQPKKSDQDPTDIQKSQAGTSSNLPPQSPTQLTHTPVEGEISSWRKMSHSEVPPHTDYNLGHPRIDHKAANKSEPAVSQPSVHPPPVPEQASHGNSSRTLSNRGQSRPLRSSTSATNFCLRRHHVPDQRCHEVDRDYP